ncbi:MAG TPA: putative Ig domain-containing protein [Bryobacteraceae bacterium]|nr:putative Ig domain-containing protein [Bryobacteraceae bacterium]
MQPTNRHFARFSLAAVLTLACATLLPAVTQVTLNSPTTPSVADPSVTNVTAIGHGFPSGTIPAGNVTVTIAPTTAGTGPSGTTIALSVTVVSGTTERVTFRVPSSISVTTATSYQISIAGTTSTGTAFQSSNSAQLTINPLVTITTTSPLPRGVAGKAYSDTLTATGGTGQYTWSVNTGSTLPAGLSLNSSTGVLSGTPTAAGTSHVTFKATDTDGLSAGKSLSITITSPLTITTSSPLPTGTVGVSYADTLTASGGSGHYSWAVSSGSLPGGLSLNSSTGVLSGVPTTAGTPSFTIKVTDTSTGAAATQPFTMTIDAAITITTSSPLPNGEVGIPYSQTLAATGGSGTYTWSVSVGTLPGGLSLSSATGVISGQPTTAGTSNFTILATDTYQATASQAFALTVNPAATLQTLSPNSANAGVQLAVTITGLNTNFVQGTTVANFGPGISVGGATAGQPGPVTVNSATSATAEVSLSSSAATGSQTVTVTTGAEQESLTNGFTILASVPIITLTTTSPTPLAPGFSGFDDEYLINGVEYWDPKYLAMVGPLKPGWVRFPSGSPSMAFDWQAGHLNSSWVSALQPLVNSFIYEGLQDGQILTQAKGGSCFSGGSCVSDYKTFLQTTGANGLVVLNGFTDTNSDSAGKMVSAAQSAGMDIVAWELDNEPYCCPKIYSTAAAYASAAYNPYYLNVNSANPSAVASDFMEGEFSGLPFAYQTWDTGITTYSPEYWQAYSYHVYAITNETISTSDEEQTLNGILAHGTTEYFDSYVEPLIGPNLPVFISELNSDGFGTLAFESYIYNAIFLAEYIARMSTIPQVKAVGVTELYLGNSFNQGVIRAVNDYESYLKAQVKANPNYSTDTSTNPNTQFQFYYSTNALALEVANTAINSSSATWATTVSGSPTVPIEGYDGNPIPAVFAQGYQGSGGQNYLLVFNKSGSPVQMAVEVNNNLLQQTLALTYISSTSDTAQNTATNQTAVQIQTATSPNPVTIGPYSVTLIQW